MKKTVSLLWLCLSTLRLIPHLAVFSGHREKKTIVYDIERWMRITGYQSSTRVGFLKLMTFHQEFRNLFYYRVGVISHILNLFCRKMPTLYIICDSIGPGLFIQHGFATIIAAKSLGKNCWVNQQVTIGYSNATDRPSIDDNVVINAGAKVIGDVKVGMNSKIGANAVVVKDVPANCTVVGVPAYIVKRDGLRVTESL